MCLHMNKEQKKDDIENIYRQTNMANTHIHSVLNGDKVTRTKFTTKEEIQTMPITSTTHFRNKKRRWRLPSWSTKRERGAISGELLDDNVVHK